MKPTTSLAKCIAEAKKRLTPQKPPPPRKKDADQLGSSGSTTTISFNG